MTVVVKYNAGDIFQVQLLGRLNGRNNMNCFHFESKRNNLFISDIQDDIAYLCNILRNLCVNQQEWYMWRHRRVRPLPKTEYGDVSLLVPVGVGTGPAMPPTVATLFSIHTALDAPAGRGRFYVPAMPVAFWDGHQFPFGVRASLNSVKGNIFDQWKHPDGFSGNMFLGVASNLTSPPVFNRMIGLEWGAWPASQRRRGYF